MENKFIDLNEFNRVAINTWARLNPQEPVLNGISCPLCGEELIDTKPREVLASSPPQKNIACPSDKCDYTGFRFC